MRRTFFSFLILLAPVSLFAQGIVWGITSQCWSSIEDPKRIELAVDSFGNVMMTNSFTEYPIQFGNCMAYPIGSQDIYYARLHNDGSCHWMHEHGTLGMEFPSDVDIDPTGCMLSCGMANGVPGAPLAPHQFPQNDQAIQHPQDVSILKQDSLGNQIWGIILLGDVGCYGKGIACDNNGNVFTSGVYTTQIWFPNDTLHSYGGSYDPFLSKHDSAGNYLWSVRMGGSGNEYEAYTATDGTSRIAITGNYTGTFYFSPSDSLNPATSGRDAFVGVYDEAGHFQYGLGFGGPGDQMPQAVAFGEDGALYVGGYFTDSLVAGSISLSDSGTGYASFLARIRDGGIIDWLVAPVATGRNYCWDLTAAKKQGVVIGGSLTGTFTFGNVTLNAVGNADGYAVVVDSNGIGQSGFLLGASGDDAVYTLDHDHAGGITAGGSYNGMLIAGPDTLNSWLDDGFVVRYCPDTALSVIQLSDTQFCTGSTLNLSWDASGCFATGNQFLFELSDSNGNFSSAVVLGSHDGVYPGNPVNLVIPPGTMAGNGYRIRIRSTMPAFAGNDNGTDIHIRSGSPQPVSIIGDTIICPAGTPVTLSASAGFSSYQWSTGDTTSSISTATPGSYWVNVHDSAGCSNSASVNIQVCVKSESEISADNILLFPNPANDFVIVRDTKTERIEADIFDTEGRLLHSESGTGEMRIRLEDLASGIYLLQAKTEGTQRNFRLSILKD